MTPTDKLAFVGYPPLGLDENSFDGVLVSCTFTWDKGICEDIARQWRFHYPDKSVSVGGPAYGDAGENFTPCLFLRRGVTITSRGCPNRCCMAGQREGNIRLLPIMDGYEVQDNNLLACPPEHIARVFAMLRNQPFRPRLTGGLEASRITREIAREIISLDPECLYTAYDRPGQRESVERAAAIFKEVSGWSKSKIKTRISCYTVGGYPGDTREAADRRAHEIVTFGFRVWAQAWRGEDGKVDPEWRDWSGKICTMGGK
jgi:hypothetical protein